MERIFDNYLKSPYNLNIYKIHRTNINLGKGRSPSKGRD